MPLLSRSLPLALLALSATAVAQFSPPRESAEALRGAPAGGVHDVPNCTVGLINTLELPASEAGVLTYVGVERGSQVQANDVLAKIDPREAELAVQRAEREWKLAVEEAQDEIEIKYAEMSKLVERADWEEVMAVNKNVDGAVAEAEIRRERLEYDRARLGEQKAYKDQKQARLTAAVKEADLDITRLKLDRRVIESPLDGEVLKLHREQGEWVQPGDVIAELARLDTLQVDGKIYYHELLPQDVQDCRVTIRVRVGHERVVEATGWVTYIDPIAEFVDEERVRYRVRAEIANRRERGRWLISPNMTATMRIHLGTAGDTQLGERTRETRVAK